MLSLTEITKLIEKSRRQHKPTVKMNLKFQKPTLQSNKNQEAPWKHINP